MASDFRPEENDGTDDIATQYLKLIQDRVVLFDEDRNGFLLYTTALEVTGGKDEVAEGYSVIGNYSDVDCRLPLMFDPPLEFVPGTELLVMLTTDQHGSGQNIAVADQEVAIIEKVILGR